MKFFNLEASTGEDGAKVLDVSVFGQIDPGFFADGTASKDIAAQLAAHKDAKRITVRINSLGGDLFGGLAVYNLLRSHGAEVTTVVEGIAASAASIVAAAGKTVMGRGSMLMIHNPKAAVFGDAEEHRHAAEALDKGRDSLLAIYKAKTGKKPAEIKKMLDAETWLTAEEAKREGFADEIADKPVKATAANELVMINSVAFSREGVPAPILAMASEKTEIDEHEPKEPGHEPEPTPDADKPKADPAPIADESAKAAPAEDLAAATAKAYAAGVAAGVKTERERIQAIDELGLKGCDDLLIAAKYGASPMDARDLAMAAIKANKEKGLDLIAARRAESKDAAGVRQSIPEKKTEALENEVAKNIARFANDRRGGSR